ncbi:MAG: penicillin-binding transpeptidase domain-containing protein [candidate division KSB1 bacterium]|nr:penicillin-binding transpeptidase domain-containing protein [candidate division KSB1 bacterium]MDZ7273768.1 penicillin-binding transpeptidase domain-containing protein [candidate division KSB1 bacterium]MDZ7285924.1 penicillin-binding transpeptidase domain-containing protein [candidate division KSB1 bacterium]MDZ7298956.1 penicillin-binding transpeptidase domain-containing protein [candidate division KSB1 bacterium]MDZ7308605.1 penicillin-binding transpeptidase domain-containing protein [can
MGSDRNWQTPRQFWPVLACAGMLALAGVSCWQPRDRFADLTAFRQACRELLGNRDGTILVMQPRTGLLLAVINERLGVQHATRPGSIFKIVTALALLQHGLLDPEEQFLCEGQIKLGSEAHHCWLRRGHGRQTLLQALANSCNIYFYLAAQKLPAGALAETARNLMLAERTGINLPEEAAGRLPEWVSPAEAVRFAVGQSRALAVTPLQMLQLVAALANAGAIYRPFYPASAAALQQFQAELVKTIVFGRELHLIREGMRQSVAYGTGVGARLAEIKVAGKTGTAAAYFGAKTNGWFIGFAPAEKPEVALVVFLEEAQGAQDAAPLAGRVLQCYFEFQQAGAF